MNVRSCFCLLAAVAATAMPTRAQYEWTSSRPDGHAPIGVMGEHTHEQGEYMLAYRYMRIPATRSPSWPWRTGSTT